MYLQTYNRIEIMNELKKKRSRFKELIETYVKLNLPAPSGVKDGAVAQVGEGRGQGTR